MLPLWQDLFIEKRLAQAAVTSETDRPTDLIEPKFTQFASSSIEFIFFKLKVMVTSCGVVGCTKNRSNALKEAFFRLPSINSQQMKLHKNCLDRGTIYGYQESILKI